MDEGNDKNWLEAAVIADEEDVNMSESASQISFQDEMDDYQDMAQGQWDNFMFDDKELTELEKLENSEAQIDEDLGSEFKDGQNKEFL